MSAVEVPVRLDRSSPVPLYHQVAEQMMRAIDEGVLQPGDPFENEVAVAQRLRLSRPTVRRAIQELVDRGLLVRRRGLGTTVANRMVHRTFELSSLHDDLERDGRTPTTQVLQVREETNERAAAGLGLAADTPLVCLTRLRSADGVPLALLHNWLVADLAREVDLAGLATHGLYGLLRTRGVVPSVARQTVGARRPSASERRHLNVLAGDPVLTMTRSAFDADGQPVEFGDHCYRASDYTIEVVIDQR